MTGDGLFFQVKEVKETDVESFSFGRLSTIGHYTAVIWADTYEVGCGFMKKTDSQVMIRNKSLQDRLK